MNFYKTKKGKCNVNKRKSKIEPAIYNIPDVASLLDINLIRAYELAKEPGFPAIRIGKRLVVPKLAFDRWLEHAAFDGQSCGAVEKQER